MWGLQAHLAHLGHLVFARDLVYPGHLGNLAKPLATKVIGTYFRPGALLESKIFGEVLALISLVLAGFGFPGGGGRREG